MKRVYRLSAVCNALIMVALLTGCGLNSATGPTGSPTPPPESSPADNITPVPTATNAPSHTVTTGPVTVYADARSYRTGDTISVTLNNRSTQTIFFPDHLTYCSIVLLQRQVGQPRANGRWLAVNPCRLEIATRMHALAAGQSLVVRLVAPPNGWLAGLYRVTLSYRTSNAGALATTIASGVFQLGAFIEQ